MGALRDVVRAVEGERAVDGDRAGGAQRACGSSSADHDRAGVDGGRSRVGVSGV